MPERGITGLQEEPAEETFTAVARGKRGCRCRVGGEQRVSVSGFMGFIHFVLVNFSRIQVDIKLF